MRLVVITAVRPQGDSGASHNSVREAPGSPAPHGGLPSRGTGAVSALRVRGHVGTSDVTDSATATNTGTGCSTSAVVPTTPTSTSRDMTSPIRSSPAITLQGARHLGMRAQTLKPGSLAPILVPRLLHSDFVK